jgi:hypothetical protein
MDEFDRQINFNSLKKSETSSPAAIAIKTNLIVGSVLDDFKKSTTSLHIYILWLSLAAQDDEMDSSNFSDLFRSLNT